MSNPFFYDNYNASYHPPMPPGRIWNDTEVAWVVPPGASCCSGDSSACLCITSADISAWDSVYNTVSANSGTWGGDLSNYSAAWQSTYYDVSANSARWNSAAQLDLSTVSAKWESAYNAYSACKALIDTYSAQNKLYSNSPVSGDGTQDTPFGLERDISIKIKESYNLVRELIYQLYGPTYTIDSAYQKWLPTDWYDEVIENQVQLAISANWLAEQDNWLWEAIKQLSGSGGGSINNFVYAPEMNASNASTYNEPNKIYFNEE